MACRTGLACGFTLTRSGASSTPKYSAVIRLTMLALLAWWPPTLTPLRFSRTRLAWWTMLVASHSTRLSTRASVSRSTSVVTATGLRLFLEAVVDALVARPQLHGLLLDVGGIAALDEHAGDHVGDRPHLDLAHAEAGDLGRADAQPGRAVPVLRRVVREQVLVGDDVGRGEAVGDLQAAAELAHVGDHLVGAGEALVRAEDRHAAGVQ